MKKRGADMKTKSLILKGGMIMKNKIFTLLAVLVFLSSGQILAQTADPCSQPLYGTVKAQDVTRNPQGYVLINGNTVHDTKVTTAEEMFKRVLSLCMEFDKTSGKGRLTWTTISPKLDIDGDGTPEVENIPVQSYLDKTLGTAGKYYVSVGRSSWNDDNDPSKDYYIDNDGTENADMAGAFYDVLEKAEKFGLISSPSSFVTEKTNVITAVGAAEAYVTACIAKTTGSPTANANANSWRQTWIDAGSDNTKAEAALKALSKLTVSIPDMATQQLYDGFFDLVRGKLTPKNFDHPCFNAVVSTSATATTKKYLDELGDITSLDAINIIQNSTYFGGTLNTHQSICTLYWILAAFKNSVDISDDVKVKAVASAIVTQLGFSKDKVTYTTLLASMLKNIDPNNPKLLLDFLKDQSTTSKIDLTNISSEVIRNEIYKMAKVPTLTYTDFDTFDKTLKTLPDYFADVYSAVNLIRPLSSLKDDDGVINQVIDALKLKYKETSEFSRDQLAKDIKGLISKTPGAIKTFVTHFKTYFKNVDPSVVVEDVVTALGGTNTTTTTTTNPTTTTTTNPSVTTTTTGDVSDALNAAIIKALDLSITDATEAEKNLKAAFALITKDIDLIKLKAAIDKNLKSAIKAYNSALTDDDLAKAIVLAYSTDDGKFDQTTFATHFVAAINASDISAAGKTLLTAVDAKNVYTSKELQDLIKARLIYEYGKIVKLAGDGTTVRRTPTKDPSYRTPSADYGKKTYDKTIKKFKMELLKGSKTTTKTTTSTAKTSTTSKTTKTTATTKTPVKTTTTKRYAA